jgi:hypothetical protein
VSVTKNADRNATVATTADVTAARGLSVIVTVTVVHAPEGETDGLAY